MVLVASALCDTGVIYQKSRPCENWRCNQGICSAVVFIFIPFLPNWYTVFSKFNVVRYTTVFHRISWQLKLHKHHHPLDPPNYKADQENRAEQALILVGSFNSLILSISLDANIEPIQGVLPGATKTNFHSSVFLFVSSSTCNVGSSEVQLLDPWSL